MTRVLLVVLLLLTAVMTVAAEWVGYRVDGVTVYVHPGQDGEARRISNMISYLLPELAQATNVPTPGPYAVFAYVHRDEFFRDTGRDILLRGVTYYPENVVRLDASENNADVQRVLAHELTHCLLKQKLGVNIGELPIWVNEGIAGHLSDPVTKAQLSGVSRLVHRDGVLSLDDMEMAFRQGERRDGAYLQSRSMVAWLEFRHPGALRGLLDALAAGGTFSGSLKQNTGLTPETWWRQWQQSIPAIFYWLSFLASPVFFAPLAILVVIAAIRQIIARRKARLEEEDEEEEIGEPGHEIAT